MAWVIRPTPKLIKILRWVALILPLVILAVYSPFPVFYYHEYYSGKVTGYEDLEKREYTFMEFGYSTGRYRNLEIYVLEEPRPLLGATSIEMKAIEKDVLEQALVRSKLTVWVSANSARDYDYSVHEGSINGEFFLTMKNYRKMHRKNEAVAIYLIPSLGVALLIFGIWFFIHGKKMKLESDTQETQ